MKKSTLAFIFLLAIFSALRLNDAVSDAPTEVENWFSTLNREKQPEKMTKMHFYFHDISQGRNVTSTAVARSNISFPFYFGVLDSADDPLTVGPKLTSKRVGYLKGLFVTSSFEEFGSLLMAMAFVFTDGIYNGSSLSVLGHNPTSQLYREIPVVGGSGLFRLARGVATLQTYFYNVTGGNATVEVDIVVLHY